MLCLRKMLDPYKRVSMRSRSYQGREYQGLLGKAKSGGNSHSQMDQWGPSAGGEVEEHLNKSSVVSSPAAGAAVTSRDLTVAIMERTAADMPGQDRHCTIFSSLSVIYSFLQLLLRRRRKVCQLLRAVTKRALIIIFSRHIHEGTPGSEQHNADNHECGSHNTVSVEGQGLDG